MKRSLIAGLASLSIALAGGAALAASGKSVDKTPIAVLAADPAGKAVLEDVRGRGEGGHRGEVARAAVVGRRQDVVAVAPVDDLPALLVDGDDAFSRAGVGVVVAELVPLAGG